MNARRQPTYHYGQLAAALVTLVTVTILLMVAASAAEGPAAAVWGPAFGGVFVLWLFAAIWALIAVWFTTVAMWREMRAPVRRPRPGSGGRPIPPLVPADRIDWAAERVVRVEADDWAASGPGHARHAGHAETVTAGYWDEPDDIVQAAQEAVEYAEAAA